MRGGRSERRCHCAAKRRTYLAPEARRELQPSAELDGRPVYVIEAEPSRGEDSEYSRVLSYVDQELCVAIKVENFDDKDKLLKTFTAPRAEIRQIGGRSIPHLVNAVDEVKGTHTDLQIDDVKIDVDLPRKHFTTAALEHGR